jgi:hypothetical protein
VGGHSFIVPTKTGYEFLVKRTRELTRLNHAELIKGSILLHQGP